MIAMAGARMWLDASFWNDEAYIAYNLLSMPAVELLGPLDSGHQFPRLYLALINQMRFAFGYETAVLRALPFAFFVLGVVVWHRLLWLRYRARPTMLLVATALCLVPGTWFAYGAMLKQYSLDVFVALLPFLLSDEELERRWRHGAGTRGLMWWALPCLVSLSYGIALLGRLVGYWLGSARSHGLQMPVRATGLIGASIAAGVGASWVIDVRHAFASTETVGFWAWQGCNVTSDPVQVATLYGHWVVDWLIGMNPYGGRLPVSHAATCVVVGAALVGAASLLWNAWRGGFERHGESAMASRNVSDRDATDAERAAAEQRLAWGTRGLSALATVGGLWAAGLLLAYPMCANRLTLFAWFSLLFVVLEGLSITLETALRWLGWRVLEWAPVLFVACVLPSSAATVSTLMFDDPPANVRPFLPILETAPSRRIVVGRCSGTQLSTLPEWLARDDIFFVDEQLRLKRPTLPDEREFWLINAGGYKFCSGWTDELARIAELYKPMFDGRHTAALHLVRLPEGTSTTALDPSPPASGESRPPPK